MTLFEEVKSVFSYLNDDYDMRILQWPSGAVYIHIHHTFTVESYNSNTSNNDINELLDRSQRVAALFESIMDCMLKLSITSDLYHNTSLSRFDTPMISIILSRDEFSLCEIMHAIQKKV